MPLHARGLRASTVVLKPGAVMGWHSTQAREELLIALKGQVRVEVNGLLRRIHRIPLNAGQCVFLPHRTLHRVVNRSSARASYLYVTAPTR